MSIAKHGLSIGIARYGSNLFLTIKVIGKLTHEDYKTITPMLDSALASITAPKIDVFIDGTEFQGWGLRAAWDDFKLGLKHKNEFRKIAIYGNKNWQDIGAKFGNWFISGEVHYFNEFQDAHDWIIQ